MSTAHHLSKEFFDLIKNIGEAKSKQEEDRIIHNEAHVLKRKMIEPDVAPRKMRELLVRLIYCEMLGHDGSFGYIHAVNMACQRNIIDKRVGYLTVSLCLHEGHELMILLVNTLQRDLKSSNHLEVCAALTAASRLVSPETIPAVIDLIVNLLGHHQEVVRKKAVMVLHALHLRDPSTVSHLTDKLRRVLCDKDPAVMGASLCILHSLAKETPAAYKDLIPSFVSILKQITEHRLPREYDYHRMPAPWIQVKLLQVLGVLGANDQRASEGMYEVLYEVLRRADIGINIGYAVIYECVRTITTIYPNPQLIEAAATNISKFITSDNHNLKYLGITALASIVQISPKYATEHQMVVIDCLEDPDETLRRKTLDLLYRMTNPHNVTVIVDKLVNYLRTTVDVYLRTDLVSRITQLAERYAPSNSWFMQTMNTVFELGGDLVRPETAHSLARLIAEGTGDDEDADMELRQYAVHAYLELLDKPLLPGILLQVLAWVLGEYGYLSEEYTLEEIITRLCDAIERPLDDSHIRCYLITAIMKLVAQHGTCPDHVLEVVDKYSNSKHVDLQQRCYEFRALVTNMSVLSNVLPVDASCEDIEVDPDLSFLDSYVQTALMSGAKPYVPSEERDEDLVVTVTDDVSRGTGLRFDAYAAPKQASDTFLHHGGGVPGSTGPPHSLTQTVPEEPDPQTTRAMGGDSLQITPQKKVWGPEGYKGFDQNRYAPYGSQQAPTASQIYAAPIAPSEESHAPAPTHENKAMTSYRDRSKPHSHMTAEKERLASALFGGIDGAPSPSTDDIGSVPPDTGFRGGRISEGRPSRRDKKSTVKAVTRASAPPQVEKTLLDFGDDLLGSDTAAVLAPPEIPQASQAPQTPQAPQASPASQAPHSGAFRDILSLYDAPTPPSPPVPTSTPVLPASRSTPGKSEALASMGDLLGALEGGSSLPAPVMSPAVGSPSRSSTLVGTTAADGDVPLPFPISPSMRSEIHGHPRNSEAPVPIAQNSAVQVSFLKVWKDEELMVVIFIGNNTLTTFTNVVTLFTPPSNLDVSYACDPVPDIRQNRLTLAQLSPHAMALQLVKMRFREHGASMNLLGRVSYTTDSGDTNALDVNISLTLADFLRPLVIETQGFGSMWPTYHNERKFAITPSAVSTPTEFVNRCRSRLNIHPVEIIGAECIAAGTLVNGETCLVHGKILSSSSTLSFILRTSSKSFTDDLQRLCQATFK